jgi:hypothetical protein
MLQGHRVSSASAFFKVKEQAMNQLIATEQQNVDQVIAQVEAEQRMFELAQRKAQIYAKSSLVPKEYQNNIGNVLIAQNMANRMGADTLMVMQNLYVVHGRPGWSAQFLIATFNSCGRFSAIRYRFEGTEGKDDWGCVAMATELATGDVIEGTKITLGMAKKEGWSAKNGSKWQTMPEQMMRYRAATFLIRATAPEIGMGLMTKEELEDVIDGEVVSRPAAKGKLGLDGLTERLVGNPGPEPEPAVAVAPAIDLTAFRADLAAAKTPADVDQLLKFAIPAGLDIETEASMRDLAAERKGQLGA